MPVRSANWSKLRPWPEALVTGWGHSGCGQVYQSLIFELIQPLVVMPHGS
jgi:hypothetical protein